MRVSNLWVEAKLKALDAFPAGDDLTPWRITRDALLDLRDHRKRIAELDVQIAKSIKIDRSYLRHKAAYDALMDYFVVNWDLWPKTTNQKAWHDAINLAMCARVQENLDPLLNPIAEKASMLDWLLEIVDGSTRWTQLDLEWCDDDDTPLLFIDYCRVRKKNFKNAH